MERYLSLKDALDDRINNEIHLFGSSTSKVSYNESYDTLKTYYADECTIYNLRGITLYDVRNDSPFIRYEDLINVTNDEKFTFNGILSNKAFDAKVIVEGADGTGKSTATRSLAINNGIICKDRCARHISRCMSNDELSLNDKTEKIYNFIKNNPDTDILFLYLSDIEEMQKRIFSRPRITDYDRKAIETQKNYLNVYKNLSFLNNLYLYDVIDKSKDEVKAIVKSHARIRKQL